MFTFSGGKYLMIIVPLRH